MQTMTGRKLSRWASAMLTAGGESKLTTASPPVKMVFPAVENVAITAAGMLIPIFKEIGDGPCSKGSKPRHLEAVITLAEEMHFGRAAERVGLSQSGLSRCIQSAEREANAKLFERDRRSIEITDAGRSSWNTHVSLSPMGREQFGRLERRRTGPGIFWRSESHRMWTQSL